MRKFFLAIILILLISSSIYLFMSKSNVNEMIDTSIAQQAAKNTEVVVDDHDRTKGEAAPVDTTSSEQIREQLRVMINDTFQSAVNFFTKDILITAIGDSLTKGVGDSTNRGGYIGILDQTINHNDTIVTFNNFGVSGNRTDQLLKRLKKTEIVDSIAKSEIVLVTIGANDIMLVAKENMTNLVYPKFVNERKLFEERLIEIIETIENINPRTHIYILGFYNPFQKYFPEVTELNKIVDGWNKTSELVTNEFEQTTFVPIKDLFDHTEVELFADDHFHPNQTGYQLMAERVLDYLTNKAR